MKRTLPGPAPDPARGGDAYWIRSCTCMSWKAIGKATGFSTQRGVSMAARRYASRYNHPWPIARAAKGAAAYKARRIGMSWLEIGKKFNQTRQYIRACAYKHAMRQGWVWPPGGTDGERKEAPKLQHVLD